MNFNFHKSVHDHKITKWTHENKAIYTVSTQNWWVYLHFGVVTCTWTLLTCEPPHDKTIKMSVRPAKTQISLGICPVWSESSLSAWRNIGSLATHWAHSEDSDQTGRMPRLIRVFAGHTLILLVLSCRGSCYITEGTKEREPWVLRDNPELPASKKKLPTGRVGSGKPGERIQCTWTRCLDYWTENSNFQGLIGCSEKQIRRVFEPPHDKTNKMTVCPMKTQISLGICPVWSESSLCAHWVAKDPSFLRADSEDFDAQADLSFRWEHMPFSWFCHEVAHLMIIKRIIFFSSQ